MEVHRRGSKRNVTRVSLLLMLVLLLLVVVLLLLVLLLGVLLMLMLVAVDSWVSGWIYVSEARFSCCPSFVEAFSPLVFTEFLS